MGVLLTGSGIDGVNINLLFAKPLRQLLEHPRFMGSLKQNNGFFYWVIAVFAKKIICAQIVVCYQPQNTNLLISIDISSLLLYAMSDSNGDSDLIWLVGIAFLFGLGLMYAAYRAFRYGEQYEYRSGGKTSFAGIENPLEMVTNIKDVEEWINQLT